MPEAPRLPLPGDEAIKLNKDYVILSVESFTSEVQTFSGWRVTLDGGKDDLLAIALWAREVAGRRSKLGSFMVALGEDMTKWTGHIIQFTKWADKNREVVRVK